MNSPLARSANDNGQSAPVIRLMTARPRPCVAFDREVKGWTEAEILARLDPLPDLDAAVAGDGFGPEAA